MYRICSLFAGVGGIDLGFEQVGNFKTVYANEYDKYASYVFEKNFNLKVDTRDIHDVGVEEIPEFDILVRRFSVYIIFSCRISKRV